MTGFQKGEYKHSEEVKKKIKDNHWSRNLTRRDVVMRILKSRSGYIPSEETKRKMSLAHSGKSLTIEHRLKIGLSNTGKIRSIEFRKKVSERRKGKSTTKGKHIWENKEHPRGMKGKTPWNYIDGESKNRKYLRDDWKIIAKQCYKRDNFMCQECGRGEGLLNAHHIIPWSISKDDSLDNLLTLCVSCHKKLHNENKLRGDNGRWIKKEL